VIKKTFKKLLLISNKSKTLLGRRQNVLINEWLNYSFNRIGEESGYGTNTVSSVEIDEYFNIDFVLKIMARNSDTIDDFYNEFYNGININNIREYIPNYLITYGAFFCNTSDINMTMCDNRFGDDEYNYLILENVKNSRTVYRKIKTPSFHVRKEGQDILDMIYQVIAALAFGQYTNNFTHYDLHTNNILEFNFLENEGLRELFSENYKTGINPVVENVFFTYSLPSRYSEKFEVFNIPVKNIYVIIDFGRSYTDNRIQDDGNPYKFPASKENYVSCGTSQSKSNSFIDMYVFSLNLFITILSHKPYLLININRDDSVDIVESDLSYYFSKFFDSYKIFFKDIPDKYNSKSTPNSNPRLCDLYIFICKKLGKCINEQKNNITLTVSTELHDLINSEYQCKSTEKVYPYFLNHSKTNTQPTDPRKLGVFGNSRSTLIWIRDNLYKDIRPDGDSLVFNWGEFKDDRSVGIMPRKEDIEKIGKKKREHDHKIDILSSQFLQAIRKRSYSRTTDESSITKKRKF
jgi:hypothetical protein